MATTVTSATLTVTLKEAINLNGTAYTQTVTTEDSGIGNVSKKLVTCPASNTTTLLTFSSNVYDSAGALDQENTAYIRVTNLDDTNELELAVVGAATLYQISLRAGESHVLGSPDALMLAEEDTSPSFGTMADVDSIQANPGANAIDVEVFVASA